MGSVLSVVSYARLGSSVPDMGRSVLPRKSLIALLS